MWGGVGVEMWAAGEGPRGQRRGLSGVGVRDVWGPHVWERQTMGCVSAKPN